MESAEILETTERKLNRYGVSQCKQVVVLDHLRIGLVHHQGVCIHILNTAMLSEMIASQLGADVKAAYLGGLLHDVGKFLLPQEYFDGHDISPEEYEIVQQHAMLSFKLLKPELLFSALIAGMHHVHGTRGYGISQKDVPDVNAIILQRATDVATIVSIADYIEAATHRKTWIFNGSGANTLHERLLGEFPSNGNIIDVALQCAEKIGFI
jgi:putative nucleotidyltransferase with HDIG domain